MAAGAVSLRNSHDIVILSFCNVVKGQATYVLSVIFLQLIVYTAYMGQLNLPPLI